MKFSSLFLSLDFLGTKPCFTVNGHKNYKTYFGSLLSLITTFIVSYSFLYFSFQIMTHKNPKLITSIYNDEIPPKISIKKKNFAFGFGLQTLDYDNYIDESIYTVEIIKSIVTLNEDGTNNETNIAINKIKCNKNEFEIIPDYFKGIPLKNLYCIDTDEITLGGEHKTKEWIYYTIKFLICKNSTENNNSCYSIDVINKYLDGGYLGIFMSDINVMPTNFSHPIHLYGKNLFTTFSIKHYVDCWLYIKRIFIKTDRGLFFNHFKEDIFYGFDSLENYVDYRHNDNFLNLRIRENAKREVYQRSYLKIQEATAHAGGIVQVCTIICHILIYFIKITLYKNYINQFFNFELLLKDYKYFEKISNVLNYNNKSIFSKHSNLNNFKIINIDETKNISQYNQETIKKSPDNTQYIIKLNNHNYSVDNNDHNFNIDNKAINKNYISIKEKNNLNDNTQNTYVFKNMHLNNFNKTFQEDYVIKDKNNSSNLLLIENEKEIKKSQTNLQYKLINPNFNRLFTKIKYQNLKNKQIHYYSSFCFILCSKNFYKNIKLIYKKYNNIQFLFDIIHFLKNKYEIKFLENYVLSENQEKAISYLYYFDYNFQNENESFKKNVLQRENFKILDLNKNNKDSKKFNKYGIIN